MGTENEDRKRKGRAVEEGTQGRLKERFNWESFVLLSLFAAKYHQFVLKIKLENYKCRQLQRGKTPLTPDLGHCPAPHRVPIKPPDPHTGSRFA